MRLRNKILSAILSLTVIASVLPTSLVAQAGSDQDPGSSGNWGSGDSNWVYNYENAIVMRIGASSITDDTSEENMAKEAYRYGNTNNAYMRLYPILIRASVKNDEEFASYGEDNVPYVNSEKWDYTSVKADIEAVLNNNKWFSSLAKQWREEHCREYLGGNIKNYTYEPAGIIDSVKMSDKGCSTKSVYLEDAVRRVYALKSEGKLTEQNVIDFWYFYTRMAFIAKKSCTGNGNAGFTTGMGEYIENVFINGSASVLDNDIRKQMVQAGYIVALYAIYGNDAVETFIGSDFDKDGRQMWNSSEGFCKSFVFDKCWTGLANTNRWVYSNVLISGHTYAELYNDINDDYANINTYKEYTAYDGSNNKTSSIWYTKIQPLWGNLLPAFTYDKTVNGVKYYSGDRRGENLFRGWSYIEISTSAGYKPFRKKYPNVEQAQMSITYNGYLSASGDIDYTKDSDKFGDNGHVMTDLVYLSKPIQSNDVKELSGINAKVSKSIKLSTPFENTDYDLKKLQYRVVNAYGSIDNKVFKTGTGDTNSGNIKVAYNDIKNTWSDNDMRYYFRIMDKIDQSDFGSGQYTDATGTHWYKIYEVSNGSYVETNKRLDGIKSCTWDSIKTDTNKFNTNCSYIKLADGAIHPIIKENNTYYLCPVQYVSNILVQVRADYVGTYGRDDVLKDSSGNNKSIVYPEYLLAKNYSTSDLIGAKNKLFSMIDNYATNVWGDVYNRSNDYSNNSKTANTMFNNGNTVYTYSVGSLFRILGELHPNMDEFNFYTQASVDADNGNVKKAYSLYKTKFVSDDVAKVTFKTTLEKTAPLVTMARGDYTVLSDNLNVLIKSYGNSLISDNSTIDRDDIYYTDFDRKTENGKLKGISGVNNQYNNPKARSFSTLTYGSVNVRSGNSSIRSYDVIYNKNNFNSASTNKYKVAYDKGDINALSAEKTIHTCTYDGVADLTEDRYTTTQSYLKGLKYTIYVQAEFPKLLATYKKYLYEARGYIDSTLTPNAASWVASTNSQATYDTLYNVKSGLTIGSNYKGNSILSKNIDNGFIRYAKTGSTVKVGDTNETSYQYTLRLNRRNRPLTIFESSGKSNVDSSKFNNLSIFADSSYNLIAPWTQSSYDIPISYTIKSHTTANKNKQALETAYNKSGSKISMFYQYSADDITTGISKYQGSNASSWKYNKVSIAVYPEVRMWAEKDFTGIASKHKPDSASDYNTVTTVGSQLRYIPATTYTILDFGGLNVNAKVVGTAVAYDTRAKKLATELGTVDTQVLYSGTAINGTISSKASGTITTYALDFRNNGALNGQDIKTAWGNSNYTSSNAASKAMSLILDQFKVSSSANMSIYNGSTLTNVPMDIASTSDADLTAGSIKEGTTRYNVYLRGSQIYEVVVYTKVGTGYVEVIRYRFIDPDGSNERDGYTKLLETGTSIPFWYNTKSCKIAVVNGRYIYNGTTELTATERNNYLAIYNGTDDVTKETFKDLRTLLINMRLYGNDSVLKNVFEYNTGVDLPNGLVNSTGGTKSYNEDCSVLQIRGYTATISSADSKSTFSEQIPINAGPATPVDKNMYFSKGYKGFINASVEVIAKNDIRDVTGSIIIAKDTVFASDVIKHKVKSSVDEVVVDDVSKAKTAIPDFIIGDVPISEALNG